MLIPIKPVGVFPDTLIFISRHTFALAPGIVIFGVLCPPTPLPTILQVTPVLLLKTKAPSINRFEQTDAFIGPTILHDIGTTTCCPNKSAEIVFETLILLLEVKTLPSDFTENFPKFLCAHFFMFGVPGITGVHRPLIEWWQTLVGCAKDGQG